MTPARALLLALAAGAACDGEPTPDRLLDTGWFEPDTGDYSTCGQRVLETRPEDGATWFWRDRPEVYLATATVPLEVRLTDAGGKEVPVTLAPNDEGLIVEAVPAAPLQADTDYVLGYTDCTGAHEVAFRTSSWGAPLERGVGDLRGRTYHLDLTGATWVEPGGFGPVLATNFEAPILVSVQYADPLFLDLLGGQGYFYVGTIEQDREYPTWDFPLSDFTEAPYFSTRADEIELSISGYRLPIHDFFLSGTFAADGSRFGGGRLAGVGDTRYAGGALGQPQNPGAFCALAAGLGVQCAPCDDGEPYCLLVELVDLVGNEVPDLTLAPVVE